MREHFALLDNLNDLLAGHQVVEFDAPLRGVDGLARVYRVVPGG